MVKKITELKENLTDHDVDIISKAISKFSEEYKTFCCNRDLCDLKEDPCNCSDFCIDCFKDHFLKQMEEAKMLS